MPPITCVIACPLFAGFCMPFLCVPTLIYALALRMALCSHLGETGQKPHMPTLKVRVRAGCVSVVGTGAKSPTSCVQGKGEAHCISVGGTVKAVSIYNFTYYTNILHTSIYKSFDSSLISPSSLPRPQIKKSPGLRPSWASASPGLRLRTWLAVGQSPGPLKPILGQIFWADLGLKYHYMNVGEGYMNVNKSINVVFAAIHIYSSCCYWMYFWSLLKSVF